MKLPTAFSFQMLLMSALILVGCGAGQEGPRPSDQGAVVRSDGMGLKGGSAITTKEQNEFIERQKEEMRKQERELQDLRRQKFHDDYFRSQYQK